METTKTVEVLRKTFSISVAAFAFADHISFILTGNAPGLNRMADLHKEALLELEKENPDLKIVDNLIAEMQKLAEKNSNPYKGFVDFPISTVPVDRFPEGTKYKANNDF